MITGVEQRAERVLAEVPDWIWDGDRLPVPIEHIADSCFGLHVRDVEDVRTAPGVPGAERPPRLSPRGGGRERVRGGAHDAGPPGQAPLRATAKARGLLRAAVPDLRCVRRRYEPTPAQGGLVWPGDEERRCDRAASGRGRSVLGRGGAGRGPR